MRNVSEPGRLRVLLVDDDEDQYILTRALLEADTSSHFELEWATDFDDALRRFATAEFDVALLDYRLGARDGVELLRQEAVQGSGVPTIMLTSNGEARVDIAAMAAGAVDYLLKSEVTAPMLRRALRYAVSGNRAVALLKQQEGALRALLQDSADVILLVDGSGRVTFASESTRQTEGCEARDLIGSNILDRVHADDLDAVSAALQGCATRPGGRADITYRHQRSDGAWRTTEATIVNRLSEHGLAAMVVTYRDVTARKVAEAEQAHLAAIVEFSDDAVFSRTLEGIILTWNRGAQARFGYTAAEAVGQHISMLVSPASAAAIPGILLKISAGESVHQREVQCVRKDGTEFPVQLTVSPMRDRQGRVTGASSVAHDISDRKRFEAAFLESEAEYRSTFDQAPVGIAHTSIDGGWLRVNNRLRTLLGYSEEQLQRTTFSALTHPDDLEQSLTARRQLLAGDIQQYASEKRYRRVDGGYVSVDLTVKMHHDPAGKPDYFIVIAHDISERKQAQRELDHLFNLSPDMICACDDAGVFTRVNATWSQVLGYSDEQLVGHAFISFVHPDDVAATQAALARLSTGQTVAPFSNRYRGSDGSYCWFEWHSRADVAARVIYAVARDQTHRRLLEDQLRQSQKMEAVGLLAGGVAHDFNNLLTAIIGFSEMALEQLPAGSPPAQDIQQVLQAGHSAAALTRQLLAFSRKQILDPEILDLNALVAGMETLLGRLIGEDIELLTTLGERVGRIHADRGQLEQVIMNLAVNARDAMPAGGALRISTEPVHLDEAFLAEHPGATLGPHVCLTVADSGTGMGPEVLAHMFEPFFTTKPFGKGTGLGLATVYGIVQQSGGFIWVVSVPGAGSSFRMAFPEISAESGLVAVRARATRVVKGTETILLVEDQQEVRGVVRAALERNGYDVRCAADGREALALLARQEAPVHLLLTDVVMPYMSGRELAQRCAQQGSHLRVLYMSGHTDDAVVRHGIREAGIDFIQKPFTTDRLLAQVRDVLDEPQRPAPMPPVVST